MSILAPTLDQIRSRNAFLADNLPDRARQCLEARKGHNGTAGAKDLWMAWLHLAGQKMGLEEHLGTLPGARPGTWVQGGHATPYDNDWDTAINVFASAMLSECPDIDKAEILPEVAKGRELAIEWARGIRSLVEK